MDTAYLRLECLYLKREDSACMQQTRDSQIHFSFKRETFSDRIFQTDLKNECYRLMSMLRNEQAVVFCSEEGSSRRRSRNFHRSRHSHHDPEDESEPLKRVDDRTAAFLSLGQRTLNQGA